MSGRWCGVVLLGALAMAPDLPAATWLERLDDALFLQSKNSQWRVDLSGRVDLEGYFIDDLPPGLLFSNDDAFFNPRLVIFLDAQLGPRLTGFAQFRADRGFDPGLEPDGDARADEYFLRYRPLDDGQMNLQAGKFATVVGNWVPRHDPWDNPFITAPSPYENVTIITDQTAPASPAAFLARRNLPDKKREWVPLIWGPSYATGAAAFGRLEALEYAVEVKNAAISSRPGEWDAIAAGWDSTTVSGRLGWRPDAAWSLGVSASHGAYMTEDAEPALPAGTSLADFPQTTLGFDAAWSWRHWRLFGEVFLSRFDVPNVGDADTAAYYLEARYKFTPSLFGALRWNQQFFGNVPDGLGGQARWDRDLRRVDVALGWRFDRHAQLKAQYSHQHQSGTLQQGEQLLATQLSVRF